MDEDCEVTNNTNNVSSNDSVLATIILQKYELLHKETSNYKYNILKMKHYIHNLEDENSKLKEKSKEFRFVKWGSIGLNIIFISYIVAKLYKNVN
jgi:hypothetical protein